MRAIVLLTLVAASSVSAALADPTGRLKFDYTVSPGKALPVKGASASNPCAGYGPGFAKVEGTGTCVKVSGGVRVDVGAAPH